MDGGPATDGEWMLCIDEYDGQVIGVGRVGERMGNGGMGVCAV